MALGSRGRARRRCVPAPWGWLGSNSPPCNLVLLWVFLIFLPSSVNREMFSHRYWLSNFGCNPSACRHNQQNKAATMICPLISWSDSNLQAPGLSDSCI
uniref:Uncharacterized protein n=1 Tax=Triticum urartu TaxID=4572 RepID=A0A8R7QTL6_TRIUA